MDVVKTPVDKTSPARRRLAACKDRGAALVEFAIVAVWLFLLVFLVIEGAFAVRARSTMGNAIDDAARRGAVAAGSVDADWQILNQLFGRGAGMVAEVERVVVYKGADGSATVPSNCKMGLAQAGTAPDFIGACNVYPTTDPNLFDPATGRFIADRAAFADCNTYGTQWCPDKRGEDPDKLEFIGVYVEAEYRTILEDVLTQRFVNVGVSGESLQAIESSGDSP